jgi:hypothetical protein
VQLPLGPHWLKSLAVEVNRDWRMKMSNNEKKLARAAWYGPQEERFSEIWEAFRAPFPSLADISAEMLLSTMDNDDMTALNDAVMASSQNGQWPACVTRTSESGGAWMETRVMPYVGDRWFKIANSLGVLWVEANYTKRPSEVAAQFIIADMDDAYLVEWAGEEQK